MTSTARVGDVLRTAQYESFGAWGNSWAKSWGHSWGYSFIPESGFTRRVPGVDDIVTGVFQPGVFQPGAFQIGNISAFTSRVTTAPGASITKRVA